MLDDVSRVRYTGFRDRPLDERQLRFQTECREGHADLAFVATGTNLQLQFAANAWSDRAEDRVSTREFVNFDREPGKVHLKSQFILNGVCVVWRGWIDLVRLDGIGCLEFDDERAEAEDALLREQIEEYNRRLREFEERQRQYRQEQERQAESEAERLVHALRSADMGVAPASSPGDEPFCPPLMAGSFGTPVTRPHLSVMKAPLSEVRTPALVKDVHTPTDLDLTKAPRPVYLY
ncbi:core-binding factor subunit beta-like isoform X2 [Pomacea canaliculata]|uniref:core-binding factor subunit beta-like isoform X2 n=1 Tax=Pomacea canaliculata TaxID=400727 RepID=UPI000D72C5EF|nr:core-binding factor subunit beta-like isoform X2 [Pomacea canaliculata]